MREIRRTAVLLGAASLAAGMLLGCSATHLVYVQETSLGISVGVGAEGHQKISLGYDRDVFAVVPQVANGKDAVSLFSVSEARITGLSDIELKQFVATGEPASEIAGDGDSISAVRQRVYSRSPGTEEPE